MDLRIADSMPEEYRAMFSDCMEVWQQKLKRNKVRTRYADGKNKLHDFGISIPPTLRNVETVVGWPEKAVEELANRSRFEGFACDDDETQAILDSLVVDNSMRLEYRQAVRSELIHSCAFAVLSPGEGGEQSVVVTFHSALTAAAVWDYRRKRIAYGIVVSDVDKYGRPTQVDLYHDGGIVRMDLENGTWHHEELGGSAMGQPMMVPLVNKPTLDRPFGRSRISRAVMSITDAAVRACLNADISSSFAASPQKYLLGVDKATVEGLTKWEAYLGSIFAIGNNREGEKPTFGQLTQPSMQPHDTWLRMLAARFAGETDIPVTSLGIIHDNPASAEAIHAGESGIIQAAEELNDYNGESLVQIARMAIAISMNKPLNSIPKVSITPLFRNPDRPSIATSTDAAIKIASVKPEFTETSDFWHMLGYSDQETKRIQSQMKAAASSQAILAVLRGEDERTS